MSAPGTLSENEHVASFALTLAALLLGTVVFTYVSVSALLIAGLPVVYSTVPAAFVIATMLLLRFNNSWPTYAAAVASVAVFALACSFASSFLDLSFDGQFYQQEAVLQLLGGWNPFYGSLAAEDLGPQMENLVGVYELYPRFPWMAWAAVAKLTDSIEAAKALQMILLVAAFSISFATYVRVFSFPLSFSLIAAAITALNPIAVCQLTNFYLDGILASLLTCTIAAGLLLTRSSDRFAVFALIASVALAANVKFLTGVVYLAVILSSFALYSMLARGGSPVLRRAALSAFLAGVLLGFHPWGTTLLRNPEAFAPFIPHSFSGKTPNSFGIMSSNMPADFWPLSRFEKIFRSLFSKSANPHSQEVSALKYPTYAERSEFDVFVDADVRVGGFGPLFASALVLSALLMALFIRDALLARTALVIGTLALSVLINPECWWARYVPQLWLIPVCVAAALKFVGRCKASAAVLGVLALNIAGIAHAHFTTQFDNTAILRSQLDELVSSKSAIDVHFHRFRSNRSRLDRRGIVYHETADLSCDKPRALFMSLAEYCERTPPA